jgi:hypothetical protein
VLELMAVAIAVTATFVAFRQARHFVTDRLRFVDAVHRRRAPFVAGLAAALVAAPVVWLLPFYGAGTAILFGFGVGAGVASGASELRRTLVAG